MSSTHVTFIAVDVLADRKLQSGLNIREGKLGCG